MLGEKIISFDNEFLQELKERIRLLLSSKELESIGRKIIIDKIKRSINAKMGLKPQHFSTALVFKKGDLIPVAFRGLPNIQIDDKGILQVDWSDWWCQYNDDSGGGWGECWDNSVETDMPGGFHTTPSVRVAKPMKLDESLTPEEMKILRKFGIL